MGLGMSPYPGNDRLLRCCRQSMYSMQGRPFIKLPFGHGTHYQMQPHIIHVPFVNGG